MDGVHAPSEASHRLSSVFIPDINLLSASCKYGTLPMMIDTMIEILMNEKEQDVLKPSKKGKYWLLTHKCVTFKTWHGSCTSTTELWNEQWGGVGWSSRLWEKGGPSLKKKFFSALRASVSSKSKGGWAPWVLPLDLLLIRTLQLERFQMAASMSILKHVKESDWVMHREIHYCITTCYPISVSKSACSRLQDSEESKSRKVAWIPHGG